VGCEDKRGVFRELFQLFVKTFEDRVVIDRL
jgi:hypothetical protein